MNLETLEHFQYIAKYKNITKAANHFYISQSTLSRNIIALEAELGAKLFERNYKKVELTEAGQVLYKDCHLLINLMDTITRNVKAADQGSSGTLRITFPFKISQIIFDALELFRKQHPTINLVVESYDFNEIPSAVQYNLYNFGFTYDFAAAGFEELDSIVIGQDSFSIALPSGRFPNPSREALVEAVQTLPLILPAYIEPPFLKIIMHELQRLADVDLIRTSCVNTTPSVILEASIGLGYGIVPTSWGHNSNRNENVTYVPLDDFAAKCKIVMIYKKTNKTELMNSFMDIVNRLI